VLGKFYVPWLGGELGLIVLFMRRDVMWRGACGVPCFRFSLWVLACNGFFLITTLFFVLCFSLCFLLLLAIATV